MASRGFFGYDPYDCYYPASPYGYDSGSYPYYRPTAADAFFQDTEPLVTERVRPARRRAPARNDYAFFPGFDTTEPAARETTAHPRPCGCSKTPDCFEIEVTGPEPDTPLANSRKLL